MHGVVSLLDADHAGRVEHVWRELADRWGLRGVAVTPIPHFSYHVARRYDLPRITTLLQQIARDVVPLRVRTAGIGLFTAPQPVLYVPVVMTQELLLFHRLLWHNLSKFSIDAEAYYRPDYWVPHITLAHGDFVPELVPDVLRWLCTQPMDWEWTVDNFAMVVDRDAVHVLDTRFDFGGAR